MHGDYLVDSGFFLRSSGYHHEATSVPVSIRDPPPPPPHTHTHTHTYIYIITIQRITMCPHGYHHNGFIITITQNNNCYSDKPVVIHQAVDYLVYVLKPQSPQATVCCKAGAAALVHLRPGGPGLPNTGFKI